MMKDFLSSVKIKILQTAIIVLIFQKINSADDISTCVDENNFAQNSCFNNLIQLAFCKAGQFAEDNYGNMFILYTCNLDGGRNRVLYGLNKDGTIYFPSSNGQPYNAGKEYQIISSDGSTDREYSKVIFLNSGNNNQYLLSISQGGSSDATELYELGKNGDENDIIRSSAKKTSNFGDMPYGLDSSYQYSLLKIPNENKYFFTYAKGNDIRIIKFTFNSFRLGGYGLLKSSSSEYNFNDNIISCFLIEEKSFLVLFYMQLDSYYQYGNYSKIIYDYELNKKGEDVGDAEVDPIMGDEVFFKGIHIKGDYSAFIYSVNNNNGLSDVRLNISVLTYNSFDEKYHFTDEVQISLSTYGIDNYYKTNEFIKINDKRLALISTKTIPGKPSYNCLIIILFDLSGEDYENITPKHYIFKLPQSINEMSAYIYNDFLVLSLYYNSNSMLTFFGYPNGTDIYMNEYSSFSPYLKKINPIGHSENDNIYVFLNSEKKIENNIFGYKEVDKIKLVSIPREILFYLTSDDGTEEIGDPLSDNSLFGENHVLKPNLYLRKYPDKYYYFDYQYIVEESDSSENQEGKDVVDGGRLRNIEELEANSKFYYGRTNRLYFKICETEEECLPDCSFESYLNKECVITGTNEEVIESVKGIISLYDDDSKILSIGLSENTFVEITNEKKDKLLDNDGNLAKIDLGECGEKIRESIRETTREYTDQPLIILKYGVSSDVIYENYVVYEIYNPITHAKIDISEICANLNVGVYIDTKMSESVSKSVEEMVDQGYNPFDPNDKFYREICTPYDSPDGTDVLLDDREEYFYSQLNTVTCPDGCGTSAYPLDTKYLKCECPVEGEVTLDLKHISGDNVKKSIKSTFKNSNWKAMLCYNLVFDGEIFGKNIGAIITLILFFIYICFFVYYVMEGITPLQNTVAELMTAEDEKKEEAEKKAQDKEKNPAVISFKNPPKKSNSGNNDNKDKISSGILIDDKKDNDINIVTLKDNKNEKRNSNPSVTDKDLSKIHIKKDSIYTEEVNLNVKNVTETVDDDEKYKDLDDFQLNNLEYKEACRYDKRSFLKTYWSVLKREHIIIFTFISRNDHNLFYVKIERFLILLCTQLFMNGLFFTDDSMHKATKSTDYSFAQQLPKIIFSLIGTHLIEVFLCYLSMTDTVMYEVKDLTKRKHTEQVIAEKINTMKKKLIAYFIVTLILFAFYWYFVAAFCAVFQNTQKIFLLDFLIGTLIGYIDPFVIYLLKEILRYLSLTKLSNRKGEIVYKISDLIPIF